jgi:hypothetical protein
MDSHSTSGVRDRIVFETLPEELITRIRDLYISMISERYIPRQSFQLICRHFREIELRRGSCWAVISDRMLSERLELQFKRGGPDFGFTFHTSIGLAGEWKRHHEGNPQADCRCMCCMCRCTSLRRLREHRVKWAIIYLDLWPLTWGYDAINYSFVARHACLRLCGLDHLEFPQLHTLDVSIPDENELSVMASWSMPSLENLRWRPESCRKHDTVLPFVADARVSLQSLELTSSGQVVDVDFILRVLTSQSTRSVKQLSLSFDNVSSLRRERTYDDRPETSRNEHEMIPNVQCLEISCYCTRRPGRIDNILYELLPSLHLSSVEFVKIKTSINYRPTAWIAEFMNVLRRSGAPLRHLEAELSTAFTITSRESRARTADVLRRVVYGNSGGEHLNDLEFPLCPYVEFSTGRSDGERWTITRSTCTITVEDRPP